MDGRVRWFSCGRRRLRLTRVHPSTLCAAYAATFSDHQRVCKVSSTPEACGPRLRLGPDDGRVRLRGGKGRFSDPLRSIAMDHQYITRNQISISGSLDTALTSYYAPYL